MLTKPVSGAAIGIDGTRGDTDDTVSSNNAPIILSDWILIVSENIIISLIDNLEKDVPKLNVSNQKLMNALN